MSLLLEEGSDQESDTVPSIVADELCLGLSTF